MTIRYYQPHELATLDVVLFGQEVRIVWPKTDLEKTDQGRASQPEAEL